MNKENRDPLSSVVLGAVICALLAGCSMSSRPTSKQPGHPSVVPVDSAGELRDASTTGASEAWHPSSRSPDFQHPKTSGPLRVEEAVRLALTYHPKLAASRARVEAAIGRKIQAGAFPNPVLSAYMESAFFDGSTTDIAEFPIGVTQTIPLGGRLGKAERVEEFRHKRLLFELESQGRELESRVRGAFAAALFARDVLRVEQELLEGAKSAAQIARERVAIGDTSADEQARAELEAARVGISLKRAEIGRKRALIELEGALGIIGMDTSELEGELEASLSLPALRMVLETLGDHPTLKARSAAIDESQARVLREESSRVPDINVGFFYRRLAATDDNAFDFGFSIPVPLFDRRQGAIREARAEVFEAEARHKSAATNLVAAVQSVYWKLMQELETATLYREELTPRSKTVLTAADERYRAGDISLAELIPVRRDHRELRLSYLELLRQIALDWELFRSLVPAPL